jgi:hypothetical protein
VLSIGGAFTALIGWQGGAMGWVIVGVMAIDFAMGSYLLVIAWPHVSKAIADAVQALKWR